MFYYSDENEESRVEYKTGVKCIVYNLHYLHSMQFQRCDILRKTKGVEIDVYGMAYVKEMWSSRWKGAKGDFIAACMLALG